MSGIRLILKIAQIRDEGNDCVSLICIKQNGFIYGPGDCFNLFFPQATDLGSKTFSFASSPTESDILITYKRGISSYKQYLQGRKVGDEIGVKYFGSTYLFDRDKKSLFVAGGVGIAPIRSIFKYALDTDAQSELVLIYQNRSSEFVFKKELDLWGGQYPLCRILYIVTEQEGRITPEKISSFIPDLSEYTGYVAGSVGMVDSMYGYLQQLGMDKNSIYTDSFDGYFGEDEV